MVEKVKEAGGDIVSVEGEDAGEWVLVDCNDVIVHIMQPAYRAYYNLEEIWGGQAGSAQVCTVVALRREKSSRPRRKERGPAERVAIAR